MNIDIPASVSGVVASVAAAAVIGGGTMVLKNSERASVLEARTEAQDRRLERIEQKIDTLLEKATYEQPRD